jgi:hypothetical protein
MEQENETSRLAAATEALERTLSRMEAHFVSLEQKIEHIVAMVEERAAVKADAEPEPRKTVSARTSALLAKFGAGESALAATSADEMLRALSVEQRIAVKAELARAGILQ